MAHPPLVLAHDLGTTGNKATLFEGGSGRPLAAVIEPYAAAYAQPGWAEQDPAEWRRAIYRGTARLLEQAGVPPGAIAAVSFSGVMNGALFLGADGEPLRSAILWADQRATAEAEHIREAVGLAEFYGRTGHRPGASYTAAKVLWTQHHQPEIYRRARYVLQAKDYAAYLMSGVIATDYSDASNTNLLNIRERAWDGEILRAIGLDGSKLPPIRAATERIGLVTPAAARLTGLLPGTPVIIGGGDAGCATVGAGSVRPGDAYNYVGSSSWIAFTSAEPLLDPAMRTINLVHLDPALTVPLGNMQSAGGALDWLEGLVRGDGEAPLYETLDRAAAAVPPGARGLLFLPHLIGERSPYWSAEARGAFIGLTMAHGRPELARAVMEGVALNLKLIYEAFEDQGAGISAMRLIGGGARSRTWRQILSDVYGLPLLLPQLLAEATSLGAAIAGGIGVGLYDNFAAASRLIQVHAGEQPDPGTTACYAELLELFRESYRALEPLFGRLPDAAAGAFP